MPTWRAEYFYNTDDKEPSRTEIIEAEDESEAADKAARLMGLSMRVDVTRTVLRPE
jgi:hypothetical protein